MNRLVLACATLALAIPATQVLAAHTQDPKPQRPEGRPEGRGPGGQEGEGRQRQPSALKGHMEALEEGVEKLGAALEAEDAATKIEDLLKAVCELEKVSIDAKSEMPRSMGRLEEKDKGKALVSYRTQMQGLTNALFEVELQLLAKDVKKAKKALGALEQIEQKGHSEFKPRRGEGRGR
ncbi:MAG: cytochrome b562 [Planctomycetota bacterium]